MLINGLLFGLISTLHCAGMCGPLAMMIPSGVKSNKLLFAVLYQVGRISVYCIIGLLVYSVGVSFSLFKMQQFLSVAMGILLVLYVIWPLLKLPVPAFVSLPYVRFLNAFRNRLSKGASRSALMLGAVNGLLPCGAIYIAALYCATFTGADEALVYMMLFGLGTMPVFIAAWLMIGKKFTIGMGKLSLIYRFLPMLIGILMILRGSDLGIPYISPELSADNHKTEIKNCCKH
jgi:uncharacterized protein